MSKPAIVPDATILALMDEQADAFRVTQVTIGADACSFDYLNVSEIGLSEPRTVVCSFAVAAHAMRMMDGG